MRATLLLCLLAGLVTAPAPTAQTALRASVVAGGAADAAAGAWRLRATVGQGAVGSVAGGATAAALGFWPTARPASLLVTLTPETTTVVAGEKLEYQAVFTVPAGGPASFQYWAVNTYPDGSTRTVLGPLTLLVTPPTAQPVFLTQIVDPGTPPGDQLYTLNAGTHPSVVVASDAFSFFVIAPGPTGSLAATSQTAELEGRQAPTPGLHAASLLARPSTDVPEGAPWLAFDDAGRRLDPGTIMDFRADSAVVAKDGPDTMDPGDAHASAADVPTVAQLGAPYPNPARDRSTLRFGLPADGTARLTVYDALGRRVADLADGTHAAGWHTVTFSTAGLAGGVYVVRLDAGDRSSTQRLTVTR